MSKVDIRSNVAVDAVGFPLGDAIASIDDDVTSHAGALVALAQTDVSAAHASIAPRLAALALRQLEFNQFRAVGADLASSHIGVSVSPFGRSDLQVESGPDGRNRVALKQRYLASNEIPDAFLIVATSASQGFAALLSARDPRLRWTLDGADFGMTLSRRGWLELEGPFAGDEFANSAIAPFAYAANKLRDAEELWRLSVSFGALKGFVAKAKTYLRAQSRPWDDTGLARATDDPHIVRQWGEVTAKVDALSTLYDEAVSEIAGSFVGRAGSPREPSLEIARSYAQSLATPLVSGVIELLGASAVSNRNGFDLFWRDLAVHALDARPCADLEDIGGSRLVRSKFAAAKSATHLGAPNSLDSSAATVTAGEGEDQTPLAARRIISAKQALAAAETVAAAWSKTAAIIDAERRVPYHELRELELSGLLAITVPKDHGGPGLPNTILTRVFRILAATDVALAQVPQNHFDFVDTLTSAEPSTQNFFYAAVLRGARFGNAIAERGRRSRRDLATTIVEDRNGYLINGVKAFCTGALTAAWVPVLAKHPDGRILTAYVERTAPGLEVREDWDAFGQRATFSGTTVLTNVLVARERVVDRGRGHPGFLLAQFAGNQLIHAAIEVGAAEGALDRASEIILSRDATPNQRDLERLGAWRVQTDAARALVDRAAALVDEALEAGKPSRDLAVAAHIAVDEAKSLAYAVGPAATGDLVFFSGAPRAHEGLDRLWRNSRTHSLHDPIRWRQFYVGNYDLNEKLAPDIARRFEVTDKMT